MPADRVLRIPESKLFVVAEVWPYVVEDVPAAVVRSSSQRRYFVLEYSAARKRYEIAFRSDSLKSAEARRRNSRARLVVLIDSEAVAS